MGFFGTYQFSGTAWSDLASSEPVDVEPFLSVDIHDSDFTTVTYAPAGPGTGVAYLGYTPRIYFENEDASAPTDVDREARGLVAWWKQVHVGSTADLEAKQFEIAGFLAADDEPPDDESTDDADVFVEIKTARFLSAMDLPLPPDLTLG